MISANLAVTVLGGNAIVAGQNFLFIVQAVDASGNPISNYSGPSTIAITSAPPDPQGNFPMPGTLNGSGFGYYLGNLKTVGTYALTVSAGPYSGTSTAFTVIPAFTTSFTVSAIAAATTGTPIGVTVTAFDHYGNIDTSYNGRSN